MIFENNSELILPLIISSLPFPVNCIKHVNVEMLLDFNFVRIETYNFKVKENILEEEENFDGVEYTQNGMVVDYNIPTSQRYLCKLLIKCGYETLSKDMLFDCIKFWKGDSYNILVNSKNLAARTKSLNN